MTSSDCCIPTNRIKQPRRGLFSLDLSADICHSTAGTLSGKMTYIFSLPSSAFPSKTSQFGPFGLHLAACFGCRCCRFSLFAFLLWFMEWGGSPLVSFPARSAWSLEGVVAVVLSWTSFALLKLRSENGYWREPVGDLASIMLHWSLHNTTETVTGVQNDLICGISVHKYTLAFLCNTLHISRLPGDLSEAAIIVIPRPHVSDE